MPDGDFDERIRYLSDEVGAGHIKAICFVDQPYAQDQHENLRYTHRSGRSHYLGAPLMENTFNFVDGMSRAVITPEGSRIRDEMIDIANDMARFVEVNAPIDTGDLRNSASPSVDDNGIEIYRRAARAARDETPESGWGR